MRWAQILAVFIIILMTFLMGNILLRDSFMTGLGMDVFIAGLAHPWQTFIGFDMMSGLFLMFGWIIYRQRGAPMLETLTWVLLGNWWGNIVIAAYILVAAWQADGDPARFFMGARAGALRPAWRNATLPVRLLCWAAAAATAIYAVRMMQALKFEGLAAWAFVPAFVPLVLAFVLLATRRDTYVRG